MDGYLFEINLSFRQSDFLFCRLRCCSLNLISPNCGPGKFSFKKWVIGKILIPNTFLLMYQRSCKSLKIAYEDLKCFTKINVGGYYDYILFFIITGKMNRASGIIYENNQEIIFSKQ
jgi:hypothetical protein